MYSIYHIRKILNDSATLNLLWTLFKTQKEETTILFCDQQLYYFCLCCYFCFDHESPKFIIQEIIAQYYFNEYNRDDIDNKQ